MSTNKLVIRWLLRLIAALIMAQSLFFKFSAAEESVYIFSTLHLEPWGRIATGAIELIASVFLLLPRTIWIGAGIGAATMAGAICSHVTILGIEVKDDGGQLFIYAVVTLLSCLGLLWIERQKIRSIVQTLLAK